MAARKVAHLARTDPAIPFFLRATRHARGIVICAAAGNRLAVASAELTRHVYSSEKLTPIMKLIHFVLTAGLGIGLTLSAAAQEPDAGTTGNAQTQQPAANPNPATTNPATANSTTSNPGGKSAPADAASIPSNGGKSRNHNAGRHQRRMHAETGLKNRQRPGGTREREERGQHHHRTPRHAK